MTFIEYQKRALDTYSNRSFAIFYPAMGLASEVGEVLGLVKKLWRDDNNNLSEIRKEKLRKEIGDILWYVSALTSDLGMDLDEIARENLEKLADRKARGVLKGDGDNR